MLKREGWAVGKKRVYRLYRLKGLQLLMNLVTADRKLIHRAADNLRSSMFKVRP